MNYGPEGGQQNVYCANQNFESIRRLCAYSVNFAEILLNMLMHKQLDNE